MGSKTANRAMKMGMRIFSTLFDFCADHVVGRPFSVLVTGAHISTVNPSPVADYQREDSILSGDLSPRHQRVYLDMVAQPIGVRDLELHITRSYQTEPARFPPCLRHQSVAQMVEMINGYARQSPDHGILFVPLTLKIPLPDSIDIIADHGIEKYQDLVKRTLPDDLYERLLNRIARYAEN